MLKLTIFKASVAFLLAAIPALSQGVATAQTRRDWIIAGLAAVSAGLVSVRAFIDKSYSQDVKANPDGVPPTK